jgi:hypothetical protein
MPRQRGHLWVPIIRSDTVCRLRVSDGVWVRADRGP